MSELRRDPVSGRWVIIASERGKRPSDFDKPPQPTKATFCPFCPGNESSTPPEIFAIRENCGDPTAWKIRVVPNKFPALRIEGNLNKRAKGIYDMMDGIGAHEVIIESPIHSHNFSTMSEVEISYIVRAYLERARDLEKDNRLQYIMIFQNRQAAGGASLEHPHSQIIATPTIPKRVMEELSSVHKYFDFKDRCIFCDMISEELETDERVINHNDLFISISPFASRFPFETWILPKKHNSKFESMKEEEITPFTQILKDTIQRLNSCLNFPPYNYVIHTAPINVVTEYFYHWHIEVIPRLTQIAGFEWGTGFYINPTPPEEATKFLKENNNK